jgi:diacylglycerol kinase family enzyme
VYDYAALRALTTWRPATFDVAVDRDRRTLPGWTVAACNATSYGGGMLAAPGARLDDGLLDMVFFAPRTRLQFLRAMRRVFKGTHVDLDFVSVRRGRELWVDADRPFDVYADGDLIGTLPATIRVVPAAVTVLAPA